MIPQYWLLLVLVPLFSFGLRAYIKATVEKSVQHSYDVRLESIRGEVRQSEERLKSDLRTKEAEIASLRDGALGGRATRVAIVDERRVEAIGRLWAAVTEMAPLKATAAQLGVIRFDKAATIASKNDNARDLFTAIGGKVIQEDPPGSKGDLERPFISPLGWALFTAYRTVLVSAWVRMKILTIGMDEPGKLFDLEPMRKMLTVALPRQADGRGLQRRDCGWNRRARYQQRQGIRHQA